MSENEIVTSSATLVPAFHVDDRVSTFLLQVKSVRSVLHQLRRTLSNFTNQELRVPVLSLAQVLDMYSLHLKYLRRHTVSVLLSQSRVGDLYL